MSAFHSSSPSSFFLIHRLNNSFLSLALSLSLSLARFRALSLARFRALSLAHFRALARFLSDLLSTFSGTLWRGSRANQTDCFGLFSFANPAVVRRHVHTPLNTKPF